MRLILKALVAAVVVLFFAGLPTKASAERVYYLVGVRHVYRIGVDKYYHADERKQIEEEYADEVSGDNSHYQYQISHGGDQQTESRQLQAALHDLAVERENRLAALYQQCDWVRPRHRCFDIAVDGPYQVIGVDYHVRSSVEVYDDYVAYAPWPGYVCEGPAPYGWNYGVVYTPGLFFNTYHSWYGGWVGFGSPAFVGFYGYGGPMVVAGLSINIGLGVGVGFGGGFYAGGYGGGLAFYSNPRLGGFYHAGPGYFASDPFRGGYIASRRDPRAVVAARAGFVAGSHAIRAARAGGFAQGVRAGARSSFAARGAGSFGRTGGGVNSFARTGAGARPTSGYAHSFGRSTSSARAGSFARSTGSARAGSFARNAGSTRSSFARSHTAAHAGSFTRSSGTSRANSFAHSSPRRSFGGTRSFAGTRSGGSTRSFGNSRSFTNARTSGATRGFGGATRGGFGGAPRSSGGAPRSSGGNRGGGGRRHGG